MPRREPLKLEGGERELEIVLYIVLVEKSYLYLHLDLELCRHTALVSNLTWELGGGPLDLREL